MPLPEPLPDDPKKWSEWRNYTSDNFYERLGLDFKANPGADQIEDHTRKLLVWWQRKLPLKNQPSNPIAQLLRGGLDEAPMYLSEARAILINPESRRMYDQQLQGLYQEAALREFNLFLQFAIQGGVLYPKDEARLVDQAGQLGVDEQSARAFIDKVLEQSGAQRAPEPELGTQQQDDPPTAFRKVLQLSGLNSDDMTDDQRDALINMAENLGLDPGLAEDMVDEYLEAIDAAPTPAPPPPQPKKTIPTPAIATPKGTPAAPIKTTTRIAPRVTSRITNRIPQRPTERTMAALQQIPEPNPALEGQRYPDFLNSIGCEMILVPTGAFFMGSKDPGAAPNEIPVTRVHITRCFISRFPITNLQYEQFDPAHRSRRLPSADDHHPVVYVASADAVKFCEWLANKERRRYRLPSEAEWEYTARGMESRIFPWGNHQHARPDVGNFADANTQFAWSDPSINDGFAETSPVGRYPNGAGPFGHEDLAGNVWEWCLDFLETYKGGERVNPRGPATGVRRIFRGGSWRSKFSSLRSSSRNSNIPTYSCNDVGFRILCECD